MIRLGNPWKKLGNPGKKLKGFDWISIQCAEKKNLGGYIKALRQN